MGLPVSMNPCENLNSVVDSKIHELEQKGVSFRSEIEALRQQLVSFDDIPSTQDALDAAIAAATVDDIDAGTTAITQIRNFVGTCLDNIYNETRKFAAEIDHYLIDAIDDITSFISLPETNLLKYWQSAQAALGVSQISSLLIEVDELLGCLADQGSELNECLSLIDNFNDRIEDVLRYTGLGENGELDLDNFIEHFDISIDPTAVTNLKSLDTKLQDLKGEALANIRDTIPSTVNPFTRF